MALFQNKDHSHAKVQVFPQDVMVLVTCKTCSGDKRCDIAMGRQKVEDYGKCHLRIPKYHLPQTVVTILIMYGMWDQLQICNTDGGTTGPTFYLKKEQELQEVLN